MSSDREKEKCIAVWLEVGNYIMQDKRDPVVIVEILKPIINEPEKKIDSENTDEKERIIILNLKSKTISGEISWQYRRIHDGYGADLESIYYGVFPCEQYEIQKVSSAVLSHGKLILKLMYQGASYQICLTGEDRKFFFAIFTQQSGTTRKNFLDKFLS